MRTSRGTGAMTPWIILAIHLLVNLGLWVLPLHFVGWLQFFMLGWPVAQVSLLGWWAALSTERIYLRFAAAAVGTVFAWLVFLRVARVWTIQGEVAAGFLMAFATQGVVAMLLVVLARSLWPRWARWLGERGNQTAKLQYGIGSLLLLTAAVAAVMGLLQIVAKRYHWYEVAEWEFFLFMPVWGTLWAIYGLVVFASLAADPGPRQWAGRFAAAAGTVGLLGCAEPWFLRQIFGVDGGAPPAETAVWTIAQAVFLYATVLPMSAGRLLRADGDAENEGSSERIERHAEEDRSSMPPNDRAE